MNFSILFDSNECTALGNILEIFISYKLHLYNLVLVVIKVKYILINISAEIERWSHFSSILATD